MRKAVAKHKLKKLVDPKELALFNVFDERWLDATKSAEKERDKSKKAKYE